MASKAVRIKRSGRLLSWHKDVKQWYLTVPWLDDGVVKKKRKYFGTGREVQGLQK